MGHRSLPASLLSSAWILATSTATRPGLPERTIRTRGRGRAWEDAAADAGCCGPESRARHALWPPLLLPHTSATPGDRGALRCEAAGGWVRGGGRRHQDCLTPDQLILSASVQSLYKGLISAQAATSLGLVPPPCSDGLNLSPSPHTSHRLFHCSP